jgi:hypothetical protein
MAAAPALGFGIGSVSKNVAGSWWLAEFKTSNLRDHDKSAINCKETNGAALTFAIIELADNPHCQ